MKKIMGGFVGALLAVSAVAPTIDAQTPPETYRIVGTGDSILSRVYEAGLLQSSDRWWNVEPGREVDNPGVRGEASYSQIWPEVIARSRQGGYVVFEDDGTRVTDERWIEFMTYIVDSTPDDRCLVGILTWFDPAHHEGNHVNVKRRRNIMWSIFQQQPCHLFINWDQAAATYTAEYMEDGQHPNAAGQRYIASRIDIYLGGRS